MMPNTTYQELLNSIPASQRPEIDPKTAGQKVSLAEGGELETVGSVMMPIIFQDALTDERVKFIFYAFVVPKMPIPMFMGWTSCDDLNIKVESEGQESIYTFDNGQEAFYIQGI